MSNLRVSTHAKVLKKLEKSSLDSPLEVYLSTLAPSGRRSMRSQLKTMAAKMDYKGALEQFPWHRIKYHHVVKLLAVLRNEGKSACTINASLAALRGVFKSAFYMGLMSSDELVRLQGVKPAKKHKTLKGRSLTKAQARKLIKTASSQGGVLGVRDAAILALMISTGLRRSEVISLDVDDYSARSTKLLVEHGKGDKSRKMVVASNAVVRMAKWQKVRGRREGVLFTRIYNNTASLEQLSDQTIYNIVVANAGNAGLGKCTPHDLRRTFVSRLLESGADLNTVRLIVGHENINTTALYDKRDDGARTRIVKECVFY